MRNPKTLPIALFFATMLFLSGCASDGLRTLSSTDTIQLSSAFANGEIRLTCELSCSGTWGSSRKKIKSLHDNGLWTDVLNEVSRIGFESDLSYYYLGRSAESLGYNKAAITYYKLSMSRLYKCAGVLNNCDGFNFPNDSQMRLDNLLFEESRKSLAVAQPEKVTSLDQITDPIAPAVVTLESRKTSPALDNSAQSPNPERESAVNAKKLDIDSTHKASPSANGESYTPKVKPKASKEKYTKSPLSAYTCEVEFSGGLQQKLVTYSAEGKTYAINGQARQRAIRRGWLDGFSIFSPAEMQDHLAAGLAKCVVSAAQNAKSKFEVDGSRAGKAYANELRKNGIPVDGVACALGMAMEDTGHPDYAQAEIEIYGKAFGNACIGREIL